MDSNPAHLHTSIPPLDTTSFANATSPTSPSSTTPREPTAYQQQQRRRRTSASSFSSHHSRSPVSARSSRHRFSNASQESFLAALRDEGGGGGLGNLADELESMSDEEADLVEDASGLYEEDEGGDEDGKNDEGDVERDQMPDAARDSGIDVSYEERRRKDETSMRNRSGTNRSAEEAQEPDDRLSLELEELITTVARMAASTPASSEDPLIPRTIGLLQDLGNQSTLESNTQRLTTSTNSLTSNLTRQTKTLHSLTAALYSPFGASIFFPHAIDPATLNELLQLLDALALDVPRPDATPLQDLQKLSRDSSTVVGLLSHITDTLQMGKQHTNAASRHLRNTETVVIELRRERERADSARLELASGVWEGRIQGKWCDRECKDILDGFERVCEGLREGLVRDVEVAG